MMITSTYGLLLSRIVVLTVCYHQLPSITFFITVSYRLDYHNYRLLPSITVSITIIYGLGPGPRPGLWLIGLVLRGAQLHENWLFMKNVVSGQFWLISDLLDLINGSGSKFCISGCRFRVKRSPWSNFMTKLPSKTVNYRQKMLIMLLK